MLKAFTDLLASSQPGKLGIEIRDSAVSLYFSKSGTSGQRGFDGHPSAYFESSEGYFPSDGENILHRFLDKYNIKRSECHVVLTPGMYQIIPLERPNVPVAELRSAIRWMIQDYIDCPLSDVCWDVIALPSDSHRRGVQKVYVVVLTHARVVSIERVMQSVGVHLSSISIWEVMLKRLYMLSIAAQWPRGVGVLGVFSTIASVSMLRAGDLYFLRQFELQSVQGMSDASFILELQRSFDYFDRTQGQPIPSELWVLSGDNVSDTTLSDMENGLGIRVRRFDCPSLVTRAENDALPEALGESLIPFCAIQAATQHSQRAGYA